MTTMTLEAKTYYRKAARIGIPVVFQNLISISLNLVDTFMIGKLGTEELAAVGAANQLYTVFTISLFGFFSGAAVFTAQYWGAKDIAGVRRVVGIDYLITIFFSILVTAAAYFFAPQIIGIFSPDEAVISFGADYLRIACFSYFFSGISVSISYNARAIQNLMVPTAINAIALCMNIVLNYFLIFGVGGFPKMGVEGAAVATLIARIFEFVALVVYIYTRKSHPFKAGPKALFDFDWPYFLKVSKTAVHVVLSEGSWAISIALIYAAYGRLGTAELAISQIANVSCSIMQSFFYGVGNASGMLIGEVLGQGETEQAYTYGKRAIKMTWVLNVLTTVAMLLMSQPIASFYDYEGETHRLLVMTMMTMAILITPKLLPYMYISGIFRAGGDTAFCMRMELFCNMFVQVPLAFFAVLVLHTSLPMAMVLVTLGDVLRMFLCLPRFKSRKWINVMT